MKSETPDILPAMTADEKARTEANLSAEVRQLREALETRVPNGKHRSFRDIVVEVSIALLVAGVVAAHGLAWYLNATVATQTDRMERVEQDRRELNRTIERMDDRLRNLETGR